MTDVLPWDPASNLFWCCGELVINQVEEEYAARSEHQAAYSSSPNFVWSFNIGNNKIRLYELQM